MDELTRFARRLVEQLGASSEGVHRPVGVAALRETVLPYRIHRRALGIDSVEDYETVLLRLVAGERGYVRTVPAEAAQRCREELASANPDLGVLDEVADATVQITSMAAGEIVDDGNSEGSGNGEERPKAKAETEKQTRKAAKSPPPPSAAPSAPSPPAALSAPSAPSAPTEAAPDMCPHCKKSVPADRQVVFCPWCGKRLIPFTCSRCNTELDSGWQHCITCGAPVKDPFSYS